MSRLLFVLLALSLAAGCLFLTLVAGVGCGVLALVAAVMLAYEPLARAVRLDVQGRSRFGLLEKLPGVLGWGVLALFGLFSLAYLVLLASLWGVALREVPEAGMQEDLLLMQSLAAQHRFGPAAGIDLDRPVPGVADESERLQALFPDPAEFEAVVRWGAGLESTRSDTKWRPRTPLPSEGTEADPTLRWGRHAFIDERFGMPVGNVNFAAQKAYRRLVGVAGATPEPLPGLKVAIEKAIPNPAERLHLLEWAGPRRAIKGMPQTEWFRYWVLVEDWCAPPEVFAARQRSVEAACGATTFGRQTWPTLLEWGAKLANERRAEDPTYPAPSDRASFVAAVDRLTGQDPLMLRLVAAHEQHRNDVGPGEAHPMVILFAFHAFYAREDTAFLAFGDGWLDRSERTADTKDTLLAICFMLAFGLALQRAARLLSIRVLGRRLGVADDPRLRGYDRTVFHPGLNLLSLAVVLPVSWLLARATLDPQHALYVRSELGLVLAVAWTVLIGSVFVEAFQHVITVFWVACGGDPERTVIDNVLCVGLTVSYLRFHDNGWVSVAAAVALGLALNVMHKIVFRRPPSPDV